MARLILIAGLPGAGKSTLARQFEETRGAVRLCEDEWMLELGLDLWDQGARTAMERLVWKHARRLLVLRQSVTLESGFWLRSDRDEKRTTARALGVAVELHFLSVPLEELARRIALRNLEPTWRTAPITREQLREWEPMVEVPTAEELELFDVT